MDPSKRDPQAEDGDLPPLQWDFHGITVGGTTDDVTLRARWRRAFSSRPGVAGELEVAVRLAVVASPPEPPPGDPDFRQENLLDYYVDGEQVVVYLPRYGRLALALDRGRTQGELQPAALSTYGVLEDLLAISLAPHLRRRGLFLVHAFAAAHRGKALLLVGGVGAGKTTTGMALLDAGWQILSNDSPLINDRGEVLSYPGVLAAYPDTLCRFPTTAGLGAGQPAGEKVLLAAEEVWPGVWAERAPIGAICFPQIDPAGHRLEPLSAPDTLRRLLPHAVEQWDRPAIAPHLAALRALVERAPGYRLRLGPEVAALPGLLEAMLPGA